MICKSSTEFVHFVCTSAYKRLSSLNPVLNIFQKVGCVSSAADVAWTWRPRSGARGWALKHFIVSVPLRVNILGQAERDGGAKRGEVRKV